MALAPHSRDLPLETFNRLLREFGGVHHSLIDIFLRGNAQRRFGAGKVLPLQLAQCIKHNIHDLAHFALTECRYTRYQLLYFVAYDAPSGGQQPIPGICPLLDTRSLNVPKTRSVPAFSAGMANTQRANRHDVKNHSRTSTSTSSNARSSITSQM